MFHNYIILHSSIYFQGECIVRAGFLLRFVKGGNKFAIVQQVDIVNVSQGRMGENWPQEEWKPNISRELRHEPKIVFSKSVGVVYL